MSICSKFKNFRARGAIIGGCAARGECNNLPECLALLRLEGSHNSSNFVLILTFTCLMTNRDRRVPACVIHFIYF